MKHPALFLYDIRHDTTALITESWDRPVTLKGQVTQAVINGETIHATSKEYNRAWCKWHQAQLDATNIAATQR